MDCVKLLREAREHTEDWRTKIKRLREVTAGCDRNKHLRKDLEEAYTNYILVNLSLKTSSLVSSIRNARMEFSGGPPELATWFSDVKDSSLHDWEWFLKDRFVTGLGAFALGCENAAFMQWVDILQLWWSPEYGYDKPAWVIRQVNRPERTLYEYWDEEQHIWFSETDGTVDESANPLQLIPVRFMANFSVPGIEYPIGDTELSYPQQRILNEIRATFLQHARRSRPLHEVREGDLTDAARVALESGDASYVETASGAGIRLIQPAPLDNTWLVLEQQAKQDLDAQSGVSEYLRGNMPMQNNVKFATQVLAAIGSQNLRIQADWVPIKELLEWCAYVWLRIAHANNEVWRSGDNMLRMRDVNINIITPRLVEDQPEGLTDKVAIDPLLTAKALGIDSLPGFGSDEAVVGGLQSGLSA